MKKALVGILCIAMAIALNGCETNTTESDNGESIIGESGASLSENDLTQSETGNIESNVSGTSLSGSDVTQSKTDNGGSGTSASGTDAARSKTDNTESGVSGTPSATSSESKSNTGQSSATTTSGKVEVSKPKFYPIIFNSDTTHIYQNVSPYHQRLNDPLTDSMFVASVQEAADAGADCYEITPGTCWVPWWPSEEFPVVKHAQWFLNTFGGTLTSHPYFDYLFKKPNSIPYRNYKDFIKIQIEACRKSKIGVFLNYRMNDAHMILRNTPENANIAYTSPMFVGENSEKYRIGKDKYGSQEYLLDYSKKEVVDFRLRMIKELIANYEIDGFELDFMRYFHYFNTSKTTKEQRITIMCNLLKEIRKALDAASEKDGRYRYLSVRIPAYTYHYGDMGIDPKRWYDAGVNIFNLTGSYFTDQDTDLQTIKASVPKALVYLELEFTTSYSLDTDGKSRIHRRTTPEQFYTTALLAYNQGADGISLFNFHYYRGDRMSDGDAPLTEPPWDVISRLKDKNYLANAPQHYFYGRTWNDPVKSGWQLPRVLMSNISFGFDMKMVKPANGWSEDGTFRIQCDEGFTNQQITVTVNGTELQPEAFSGEPYANMYTQLLGNASNTKCFKVPKSILKEGNNSITVKQNSGNKCTLNFVDLAIK